MIDENKPECSTEPDSDRAGEPEWRGGGDEISVDLERRILCPDGACVGVIGPDGRCKVCGTVLPGGAPGPASSAPAPTELAGTADDDASPDLDSRVLCPDGACIGVIGPDGRCRECGRALVDDASATEPEVDLEEGGSDG